MRKLLSLFAGGVLALGVAGVAIAADDGVIQTGRVLIALGGDIEVSAGEQAETVIVVSGNATVAGAVKTLFVADGAATTVSGARLDSLTVINGTADLVSGTVIAGDINQASSTINRAADVQVGGTVRDLAGDIAGFGLFMGAFAILLWIGYAAATILVGLLTAGLAARQVRQATTLIGQEPGRTFLIGLLSVLVPPILMIIAAITVIGIPAALGLLIVVWPMTAFVGYMVAAIWIGEWLLGRTNRVPAQRPYLAAVVGLVVAFLLGFIPMVTVIVSIFGLGAVVLAAWRTLRREPTPAGMGQAEPAPSS